MSLWVLVAVVVAAPFPFGSTEPFWMGLWAALLAVCLATAPLRSVRGVHVAALAPAVIAFGIYAAVAWYQTVLGTELAHPIWSRASELLGERLEPSITVTRGAFPGALGPSLLFTLTFVCAFLHGTNRNSAATLLQAIGIAGLAYAAWGVFSLITAPTAWLWREKLQHTGSLTATFASRNTAATFVCLLHACYGGPPSRCSSTVLA